MGKLTFLFGTRQTPSADVCNALAKGPAASNGDPDGAKIVHFGDATFHVEAVSDAGLSHFVSGKLYTTYRSGTCFLFEEDVTGLDGYAGDVTEKQWTEIHAHMEAIAPTIRFEAQSPDAHTPQWTSPPIVDADPSHRHDIEVKVPTRLRATTHAGMVQFEIDPTTFETIKLSVGRNMVTGLRSRRRVYPADKHPGGNVNNNAWSGLDGMIRFDSQGISTFPLPAPKSIVEIDLLIFETDIRPQHLWMPESPKYKVLWQRNLTKVVDATSTTSH